jgi:hypothetical protein
VLALVAGARRADHAIDRYFNATEIPEVLASSQGGFTPALMAARLSLGSGPTIACRLAVSKT